MRTVRAAAFLCALLSATASIRIAGAQAPERRIDALIEASAPGGVLVCAAAVDLRDGARIYSRHSSLLVRPASTLKILTAAALLRSGTAEARLPLRTTIEEVEPGTVVLRGDGDSLLSAEDLARLCEQALPGLGANVATVLVDSTRFAGPPLGRGWMWDDEPAPFMPWISALSVDRGTVRVRARPGDGSFEVDTEPRTGFFRIASSVAPGNAPLSITRGLGPDSRTIRVAGGREQTRPHRAPLSVPDPDIFAGHVLARMLSEAGRAAGPVRVERTAAPREGRLLAAFAREVEAIVECALRDSDNLSAECLLRAGLPRGATAEEGIARIARYLETVAPRNPPFRIVDGSGVSHYNLLSADLLLLVLQDMHAAAPGVADPFHRGLPVAGRTGTLSRRMDEEPARGRIAAKTGTISGASNLAGYVMDEDGRAIAFAILCQGGVGPASPLRNLQDGICAILAEHARRAR